MAHLSYRLMNVFGRYKFDCRSDPDQEILSIDFTSSVKNSKISIHRRRPVRIADAVEMVINLYPFHFIDLTIYGECVEFTIDESADKYFTREQVRLIKSYLDKI
jgi:hypothetical protein